MRILIFLAAAAAYAQTGNTRVDYPSQIKNGPIYSDAGYPAGTVLSDICPTTGTLSVTQKWTAMSTQTVNCPLAFNGGLIQPASGQTVTLPVCPSVASQNVQYVDVSAGGHVSIPKGCPSSIMNWGATTAATDNASILNEMAAYVYVITVPEGTFKSASTWTAGLVGQTITCANPQNSILQFTGASQGIDMYNASASLNFNGVYNCNLQTTNASGNSALIVDSDAHPASNTTVQGNWITTSGSGNWINGIRVLGCNGCIVYANRVYGAINNGIVLGDGAVANTFTTVQGNLIGALNSNATGLALNFSQDTVSIANYIQGVQFTQLVSLDAASDLTMYGDDLENDTTPATYGVTSEGVLRITALRGTGLYGDFVRCHNGSCSVSNVEFNGNASDYIAKITTSSGSSFALSRFVQNNHPTGGGVNLQNGPHVVSDVTMSTVGGDLISIQGTTAGVVIRGSSLTTTSGHGISTDRTAGLSFSFTGNTFAGMSMANVCYQCYSNSPPSAVTSATGNWLTGTGWVPDELFGGTDLASASTITLTGVVQKVTGTATIATINVPWTGFTGCVYFLPAAAWSLTTSGNIIKSSTAVPGQLMTLCNNYGVDTNYWYPSY